VSARAREAIHEAIRATREVLRRQALAVGRDPRRARALVACLAMLAVAPYVTGLVSLQSARRSFGETHTVWSVTRDVDSGESIVRADLATRDIPLRYLPPRPLVELPESLVATRALTAGEVLTRDSTGDGRPTTVVAPVGWRLVAVSPRAPLPPLAAGDRVDVIADARVLAEGALVVSVVDGGAVVAVPPEQSALVATAAANGTATLTVAG
jgi:hypothetical protein